MNHQWEETGQRPESVRWDAKRRRQRSIHALGIMLTLIVIVLGIVTLFADTPRPL